MYQAVHGSPRAGIPPLVQSWAPIRTIHAIERTVFGLIHGFEAWRERRAGVRNLQALDDRLLQDVGIERREIPEIVAMRSAGWR